MNCLHPLEVLGNTAKIDDEQVYVNPIILCTRLTSIAEREDDVEKYFSYQMSPILHHCLTRKDNKVALRALSGDKANGNRM